MRTTVGHVGISLTWFWGLQEAEAQGATGTSDLTSQIVSTMPVLDAFGNACTQRNDDSSRFGASYLPFLRDRTQ